MLWNNKQTILLQASSRGGSPAGSPEPSGPDVDENGASSCSSGGGSRQSSVRAAFGSLDAAVGRGGGGGAEAGGAVGGGDGSLERRFVCTNGVAWSTRSD